MTATKLIEIKRYTIIIESRTFWPTDILANGRFGLGHFRQYIK